MTKCAIFFATTRNGRRCIKVTGLSTPPTGEEVLSMAKKMIAEDKTPPAKGKLRRFLRAESRVKSSVRLF